MTIIHSTPRARVLVVDDESGARSALTELLRDEGYETYGAGDGYKALGRLDQWVPDVVLTDLKMPGMDGIVLMEKLRERVPSIAVIVMTAFGTIESAVDAVHKGADDYLSKPLHLPNLLLVLQRVLHYRELRREADRLRAALSQSHMANNMGGPHDLGHNLIGQSPSFRTLLELVRQVASSDASVLITGAQGSGKREIGRLLHHWSHRGEAPFVAIDCNATDPSALNRELFGYGAGAFAGATVGRPGKIAQAAMGTLYLDEVANLPLETQARLFQCLQEGVYEREGGGPMERSDVRVLAATAQNLAEAVHSGRFREDLYYRIKVINLQVPSLRERRDDIPLLAARFLQQQGLQSGRPIRGLSERALGVLMQYEWPGNIRELHNVVAHAVAVCQSSEVEPRDLPKEVFGNSDPDGSHMPQIPGATLAELERYAILKTLEHVGGSTSKAADILGISPRKIQYRLNDYRAESAAP